MDAGFIDGLAADILDLYLIVNDGFKKWISHYLI